jgi:hypothetical protein
MLRYASKLLMPMSRSHDTMSHANRAFEQTCGQKLCFLYSKRTRSETAGPIDQRAASTCNTHSHKNDLPCFNETATVDLPETGKAWM